MDDAIKTMAQVLLGEPVAEDLLAALTHIAVAEACAYCNRPTMPPEAVGTLAQMVVLKYNRRGTEGATAEGYSGVTESYVDGYPSDIKHALMRWRKLTVI